MSRIPYSSEVIPLLLIKNKNKNKNHVFEFGAQVKKTSVFTYCKNNARSDPCHISLKPCGIFLPQYKITEYPCIKNVLCTLGKLQMKCIAISASWQFWQKKKKHTPLFSKL